MTVSTLNPEWLAWPRVQRVLDAFRKEGVEVCFIGGSVRDALIGKPPADFDILMSSPLAITQRLLRQAGIEPYRPDPRFEMERAIIDGQQFEFLHSPAAEMTRPFKERVALYAQKADFTITGLYWFLSGELHDDFGGVEDLKAGRIRFIGDPEEKLGRYASCALRFFRFHAWFGKTPPDPEILRRCVAHAPQLLHTQAGTVFSETRKLLSAPLPYAMLKLMHEHDIIKYALGCPIHDLTLLERLARIEIISQQTAAWRVRLALLLLSAPLLPEKALLHLAQFWEMEKPEQEYLAKLLEHAVAGDVSPVSQTQDVLLLRWALEDDVEAASENYMRMLRHG